MRYRKGNFSHNILQKLKFYNHMIHFARHLILFQKQIVDKNTKLKNSNQNQPVCVYFRTQYPRNYFRYKDNIYIFGKPTVRTVVFNLSQDA